MSFDVVTISTSGDLSWLDIWTSQIKACTVYAATPDGVTIQAPSGFTVRQVTRSTAAANPDLFSLRELAILACKNRYILFLDESQPARTPQGQIVNIIKEHTYNLEEAPSSPFFFNTLYDPFREGADFVRGYPFSLREGRPTAVSHGLVLGHQEGSRPAEIYVDATLTVPKGALVNLSLRNTAINRELAGVCLYSGPVEGDTTWASHCVKVIVDHLGYGCKTGLPYVSVPTARPPSTTPPAFDAAHQDLMIEFFTSVRLSDTSTTPQEAYRELIDKVRQHLGNINDKYKILADGMAAWLEAFTAPH